MSESGMRNAESVVQQSLPVGGSASFHYGSSGAGAQPHPQPSLGARSYSDLGRYGSAASRKGGSLAGGSCIHEEGDDPDLADAAMSPRDMAFFQQYNCVYRETEMERGGRYPRSYGGEEIVGRGGVGSWSQRLADPEAKRRARVASYRAIALEGKMKASMKKSVKWLKQVCASWLSPPPPPPESAASSATYA